MAEDVVFKVSVQGKSLGELKKEFAEINRELSNAKAGTAEYQKTLERLGDVKDEIGDLRDTISALNPEGKVAAFQNVAGKLAGGFQAATGAAALFGSKSEELEKQLLKVQAATAFAQGIQSIVGLSDAFAVLKATLLSFNPVLLAVAVAITAITAAYVLWNEELSEAAQNDKRLNDELERSLIINNKINEGLNRQLELLRVMAKNQSEVYDAEREAEIIKYSQLKARLILLNALSDKTDDQIKEIQTLEKETKDSFIRVQVLEIKTKQAVKLEQDKIAKDNADKAKQAALDEEAAFKKRMQGYADEAAAARALRAELSNMRIKAFEDQQKLNKSWTDSAKENQLDEIKIDENGLDSFSAILDKKDKKRKEDAEKEKKLAQEVADAKVQLTDTSLQSMRALSDIYFAIELGKAQKGSAEELKLRKKQFEVTKAFNLAAAVVDGIRSVQAAYLSGLAVPIIGPATGAAYAVLSGIVAAANIAKIASAKFEGGGSVTPTIPSGNPTVPTINTASQTQPGTRLNPDGTPQTSTEPIQAYVLEKELTDAQKRSGRIQKQGKF